MPAQVSQGGNTYNFAGWTGDVMSANPSVTITATHPIMAKATLSAAGFLGVSGTVWNIVFVFIAIALILGVVTAVRRRRRHK